MVGRLELDEDFPLDTPNPQKQPPEVFCKRRCSVREGVLRDFAKLAGKHLCQSLLFNKVAVLRPATLLKKRPWHRVHKFSLLKVKSLLQSCQFFQGFFFIHGEI